MKVKEVSRLLAFLFLFPLPACLHTGEPEQPPDFRTARRVFQRVNHSRRLLLILPDGMEYAEEVETLSRTAEKAALRLIVVRAKKFDIPGLLRNGGGDIAGGGLDKTFVENNYRLDSLTLSSPGGKPVTFALPRGSAPLRMMLESSASPAAVTQEAPRP